MGKILKKVAKAKLAKATEAANHALKELGSNIRFQIKIVGKIILPTEKASVKPAVKAATKASKSLEKML